jgi:hypothetical protein
MRHDNRHRARRVARTARQRGHEPPAHRKSEDPADSFAAESSSHVAVGRTTNIAGDGPPAPPKCPDAARRRGQPERLAVGLACHAASSSARDAHRLDPAQIDPLVAAARVRVDYGLARPESGSPADGRVRRCHEEGRGQERHSRVSNRTRHGRRHPSVAVRGRALRPSRSR